MVYYTKIIYKDELDSFLENFKELVQDDKLIGMQNKTDMVKFVNLFEKHLSESVISINAIDLRSSGARVI